MEWTGAGILPVTKTSREEDYFLLTKNTNTGRWGDLGGMRLGSECPPVTAARKAAEEANSALGSKEKLHQQIHQIAQECVSVGPYRLYICRFKPDEVKDVVRTEWLKSKRFAWVSKQNLFNKIALHAIDGPKRLRIQGKTLSIRTEQCIRRSTSYKAYIDRDPNLKAREALAMGRAQQVHELCYRLISNTPGSSPLLAPLVVFRSKEGKPSRCFAVLSTKGEVCNWVIKDYTSRFNSGYSKNLWEYLRVLLAKFFPIGRAEPSLEERWAIAKALENRSIWSHLYGRFVPLSLSLGTCSSSHWTKPINPDKVRL